MKYLLLFPFQLLFAFNTSAQITTHVFWTEQSGMPGDEVIYYKKDKGLQWQDFKGEPKPVGNVAAITMSGFGYKASLINNAGKGQLAISVYCYFSKNKSWVMPGRKTAYILNHEQHHFDISFITASLFVTKLQAAIITVNNYNVVVPSIYKECSDFMNKLQSEYDGQTRNGQLKEVQEKWNIYLDSKLSSIAK